MIKRETYLFFTNWNRVFTVLAGKSTSAAEGGRENFYIDTKRMYLDSYPCVPYNKYIPNVCNWIRSLRMRQSRNSPDACRLMGKRKEGQ